VSDASKSTGEVIAVRADNHKRRNPVPAGSNVTDSVTPRPTRSIADAAKAKQAALQRGREARRGHVGS